MTAKSVQAPTGGINRLASIDDMPEEDAYYLDNWIADAGFCRLRGGSKTLANFGANPLQTITPYGDQLIIAIGGAIVDTGFTPGTGLPTVGSPTTLGSGFSVDRWQTKVVNGKLLLVNGTDTPQQYDGTTLSAITFTSGIADEEELIGVSSFKGRAFYWKSEAGFYYAEAGSYQGAMSYFDLSPWVSRLSELKLFFTWSADAGDGTDDFAVFLFDTGEALVYQGTDPSSLDYWALVGKYEMGAPLSVRSSTTIAGDQIVLTKEGWQNFKTVWQTGNWRDDGIGRKITGLAVEAAETFWFQDGWEVDYYPEERLVIVNVPQGTGTAVQHVLNTNTMAWSTFSGWNAETFGSYQGDVYYGDEAGNLIIAMYGSDDDGETIVTDALPAYNYLSGRANNKQLTGVRPVMAINSTESIAIEATADFDIPSAPDVDYVPATPSTSPWGSPWGSPWSTGIDGDVKGEWESANAFGYALSYRMKTVTSGEAVRWGSTQLMFKDAGVI